MRSCERLGGLLEQPPGQVKEGGEGAAQTGLGLQYGFWIFWSKIDSIVNRVSVDIEITLTPDQAIGVLLARSCFRGVPQVG